MSKVMTRFEKAFLKKAESLLELIMQNQEKYGNFSTETGDSESLFTEEESKVAELLLHVKEKGLKEVEVKDVMNGMNRIWSDHLKIKEEGIKEHNPVWSKVDPLISENKIRAIKEYRSMTGEGLKESKKAVDKRQKELGISR